MNLNGMLAKALKIVFMIEPKNWTGAAGTDEYVNMKAFEKVCFIIQTGAWAGGTAAVTLVQAKDVAGTDAKALAFTKMYTNDGATTTDTLTETTVANNTFNLDAVNALYVIEVNSAQLDVDNGFDCVNLHVASPGANNDLYSAIALCYGARYEDLTGVSAIV
jgi:hypothetical protein